MYILTSFMIAMMSSFRQTGKERSCNEDQETSDNVECHHSIADFFLTDWRSDSDSHTQITAPVFPSSVFLYEPIKCRLTNLLK